MIDVRWPRWLRWAVLLGLLLAGVAPAAAAARPGVRDEAGFFSAAAVAETDRAAQEIRQQQSRDLVVETLPRPPADVAARLRAESRDRVYAEWAERRARDLGVDGIYVLITRSPAYLQVAVGNRTLRQAFTAADRDRLRDILLAAFRDRRYDDGLREAVAFTRRTLAERLATARPVPAPPRAPAPPAEPAAGIAGVSWRTILLGGGLLLVALWVLGRLFRSRSADAGGVPGAGPGAAPGPGPGYGAPGYGPGTPGSGYGAPYGGGGFGRGLLGGLLGGLAGGYLLDRLRGHGDAEAAGPGGVARGGPGEAEPASDTDYSSSGGDFDAGNGDAGESAGGDFGDVDDAGGGDFGGDSGTTDL